MKKLLVLTVMCLLASLVFFAADRAVSERKPASRESFEEVVASAYEGEGLKVLDMRVYPRSARHLDAVQEESFLCLWSAYYAVPDPETHTCEVQIETIDALCNPVAGNLTTMTAFYKANAKKVDDVFLGPLSVTWGYLPSLPSGWCWIFMVYWEYGTIPYLPDEYWFDRASAYNHGDLYPPILGYCGWPLSTPPDPFLVHCP